MDEENFYVEMPELADIDAWDGEVSSADAGEYRGTITKVERSPTKADFTQLVLQTEINALADGSETPMVGRLVFSRYNEGGSTPKGRAIAMKRLKALCLATGVKINERGGYNAKELEGKEYAFTVYKEEYTVTDEVSGDEEVRTGTKVRGERKPDGERVSGRRATS